MVSLQRIKRLNRERDSKSCEMSIEHDSSPRLHSRGSNERIVSAIVDPVQCRVLLGSAMNCTTLGRVCGKCAIVLPLTLLISGYGSPYLPATHLCHNAIIGLRYLRLIPLLFIHHILQRLALHVPVQVFHKPPHCSFWEVLRAASSVGCQNHIG